MVRQRVRRLANPRRTRKARASRSRLVRNRKGQFIKRSRARPKRATAAAPRRRRARVSSPRRRVRVTTRSRVRRAAPGKVRRRRRSNPVLVTLGMVNPRRKRRTSTVARRTRKRRNPVSRRRRRNATRRIVVVTAPRRRRNHRSVRVSGRRRNPAYSRRRLRNPELFGSRLGSRASLEMVLGGLIGVTAAKLIPGLLPASLLGSPIMRIVISGASAWAAGMVATKVSGPFGNAVLFGGLMQTGSLALNAFIPSIGGQIGLRGLGDIVPGYFPVPQNPIYPGTQPMAGPVTARTGANGIGRAWGPAWGA